MSQLMLIEGGVDTRGLRGLRLSPLGADDDFLQKDAMHHFGEWRNSRLVTDGAGSGEALIDDVCDAQLNGTAIEDTTFVGFLRAVVESGARFLVWHGSDYSNLPTVYSWRDMVELLREQTRLQSADVFLRFVPADSTTVRSG